MVSLLGRRHKRTPIGLDIGANGVCAAQLTCSADRYMVTHIAESEWPVEASDNDEHAQRRIKRIRSCVEQVDFRGRSVVAALNPPDVEFHALELPAAVLAGEDSNASQVVRWEVERLANERGKDLETRHWSLPPTKVPAPNAIGVAAGRDVLAQTLKTCGDAGLLCTRIDVAAAALARFGAHLSPRDPAEVWGVLDVGHAETRLVLCVDDVPVVVRRAGSGSNTWTERIAGSLQLSTKAAEVHKRKHGIALTGRGVRRGSRDAPDHDVGAILLATVRSELKELASEVKRSYEYVLSCYPRRSVGDLILVGGGAVMRNLPEFLSAALGIPVRRASGYLDGDGYRLRCTAVGQQQRLEVLALAIGLAIGQ